MEIAGGIGELFASYTRHLRALGRSPKTIESYGESVARLVAFTGAADIDALTPDTMRRWLMHEQAKTSPGSVGVRYRSVRAFLRWCVAEGELERSPLAGIGHPAQPDTPVPILEVADLRKLLKVTDGPDWRSRRDRALVLFFLDSGCRRAEVAGLKLGDVDLDRGEARVQGKGSHVRVVSIGATATAGLDKWLRARRRLPFAAGLDDVWIGDRGALSAEGVRQALKRLGRQAGLGAIHPHQLRHTWAHALRAAGMGDAELMELAGWKSPAMLSKYGRSAVGARARDQHKGIAPGDQL